MKRKKVYILLTDTGTILTRLIKLYTNERFNHASIAFDSDLSEVYSFGRKSTRNPFVGGFVKEDMTSSLFNRADCVIYSLEVTEEQFDMMKQFVREIEACQDQYRYNFLGLFGFLINRPIERKNAFFCSQFVASVLNECDTINFDTPFSLIAPKDLQNRSELKLVYQGKLKDYTKTIEKIAYFPFQLQPNVL